MGGAVSVVPDGPGRGERPQPGQDPVASFLWVHWRGRPVLPSPQSLCYPPGHTQSQGTLEGTCLQATRWGGETPSNREVLDS